MCKNSKYAYIKLLVVKQSNATSGRIYIKNQFDFSNADLPKGLHILHKHFAFNPLPIIIIQLYFNTVKSGTAATFTGVYTHYDKTDTFFYIYYYKHSIMYKSLANFPN